MHVTQEAIHKGQAVYSPFTLKMYNALVLGLSNSYIWKCSTQKQLAHYNIHVSGNHLDIGVGTGYYLENCQFPSHHPRIALLDMNISALHHTATQIAHYRPEVYQADIFDPIRTEGMAPFDSVAINYLLHCLPGTLAVKGKIFENIRPVLNPGGVVFGATILQGDVPSSFWARRLMALYNKKGIFTNTGDTRAALEEQLNTYFSQVTVDVIGCVALFSARHQPTDKTT